MAPIRRRVCNEERGAALVEFALVLPLLLVVIAGIVDFGFAFQRSEILANAAREGARLGSLQGFTGTVIEDRVREYVRSGVGITSTSVLDTVMPSGTSVIVSNPNITLNLSGGGTVTAAGTRVDVFYHHQFMLLGPIMGLINHSWAQSITLKATSVMRIQANGGGS
jgi:Flp pilus assembly protein TadG